MTAAVVVLLMLAAPAQVTGFSLQQITSDLYVQPVIVHGYVMTRAQITGSHGGPILVKVRSTGEGEGEAATEEIAEIGEVYAGDAVLSKLYILPGETYRSYQIAWNRIKSERMDVAARADFLSPQALAAGITLADGTRWQAPNGYFSPLIKTVVLKEKSGRIGTNPENWILLRVPFLFTAETPPLEENVLSVLLDAEGKIYQDALGKAFDRSPPADGATAGRRPYDTENFTYRVGYWGVGNEPQQASPGLSNLWGLVGWAPDPAKVQAGEQRIFGPVAGAHMEYFDSDGASDAHGFYQVSTQWPCVRRGIPPFHIWVDPVVEMNIWMTLQTISFNPNQSLVQPFMMHQDASFRCGYLEWDALTHLFFVDAIWLTGKVAMANDGGDLVQISGSSNVEYQAQAPTQTPMAQTTYDFDGDGNPDRAYLANKTTVQDTSVTPARSYIVPVIPEDTATAQWQAVYFSSSASNRLPTASALADRVPDLWRLADHAVNEKPAGKLASISPAALANTDIYVFRESTGELMVEMKGMKRSRNGASLDDVIDNRDNTFYWQTLIRGRAFNSVQSSFAPDRTDADFQATNASMGFQSRYQDRENNTPAPGEWLKVIAINRTTGYTGSRRFQLGMPGDHTGANAVSGVGLYGDLSQYIPQITLRPPRLKVWARRIAQPTGGLAQSASAPESERTYFIGHEGAATQKDKLVAIYTRWVDWDEDTGTETTLPEGLGINRGADFGLTGRLAKLNDGQLVPVSAGVTVSGDATLQDAAQEPGQVAQFPIGPGEQMQILRLGSDLKVNEHYYINVFGKPVHRAATDCSPCDFERAGANPGLLASRPNQYTPFYVPVYDEAATLKLKLERNQMQLANSNTEIGKVDPLYAWVMRPEYQFSLIDLEVSALSAIRHTLSEQGQPEEVVRSLLSVQDIKQAISGADLVRLMYSVIISTEALLPGFDTPNASNMTAGKREFVFSVGEDEVPLSVMPDGSVELENLSHISRLSAEDILTIRLYLNGDPTNVLWQLVSGPGQLDVNTAYDPGSRSGKSFLLCEEQHRTRGYCGGNSVDSPENQPIIAWVNEPFPLGTRIIWRVEALRGNPAEDDLPSYANGGSGDANKPYAYGKIRSMSVGNAETNINAVVSNGSGTGRFQDAWSSPDGQNALAFNEAQYFSFRPDMSNDPQNPDYSAAHMPETYASGGDNAVSIHGTKNKDVWRHNPQVGYKITATVVGHGQYVATVRMDERDVLIQEYISHAKSANLTLTDANTQNKFRIPLRSHFRKTDSMPPGDWVSAPYLYGWLIEDGMIRMWNGISNQYAGIRSSPFVVGGVSHDIPTNALVVSSGYRNPERNERVSAVSKSMHMSGRAVDFGFVGRDNTGRNGQESATDKMGLLFGSLWEMVEEGTGADVQGNFWQLERAGAPILKKGQEVVDGDPEDGIPDVARRADHLHIEDEF